MNRKHFLRTIGAAALVPFVPSKALAAAGACETSPSVPEGPFYFDAQLVRQDITEGRAGIPIEYRISVVDTSCRPIANAAVDVWQCDVDGVYSGYPRQATGADTSGMTFLRGVQRTDADGLARFSAIYPGWYPTRVTHLHVKIHVPAKGVLTTNLFYPDEANAEIYSHAPYKAHGPNRMTVARDVELKGDIARYKRLMFNVSQESGGRYVGTYTFAVAT